MKTARDFLHAADVQEDEDLTVLMRSTMLGRPVNERLHWLKEIELALDGFGG